MIFPATIFDPESTESATASRIQNCCEGLGAYNFEG